MKLRTRLFLIFLMIMGVGVILILTWFDRTVVPIYLASLEDDLVEKAAMLATLVEEESPFESPNLEALGRLVHKTKNRRLNADIYGRSKEKTEFQVMVTDPYGTVIYDSEDGAAVGMDFSQWNDVARTLQGGYGARATRIEDYGESMLTLYVAAPIILKGRLAGALTVSKSTAVIYDFRPRARTQMLLVLAIVAVFVFLGGLAVSFWVSRPIRKLTRYAEAVTRGQRATHPRLGKSDLGQMAEAFESMRMALDGKRYVEGYVQTLTHEIKSPLSAINGAAELIDDAMPLERRQTFLNHIRMEAKRIQQLVDRLLELSSLENRSDLRGETEVDLGLLAQELLENAQPGIDAKKLEIRFSREDALRVVGEPFLLRLAVSNLLQNAIAFSPRDGWIAIDFGRRSIRVTDSGPGVPDYAKKRIFQRFFSLPRTDSGRKSSGLGLTIVNQIAELHQGGVQLRNVIDAGAQAILWFPMDRVLAGGESQQEADSALIS